VVANGGRMITPTITRAEIARRGSKPASEPVDISEGSIQIVREAMRGVVASPHGTAWRLNGGPYAYAGKTGTAQVVRMREDGAKPAPDAPERFRDHALFIAFAPYDNPRIAVAVVAENSGHGGEVAAPIAKRIMDAYLAKLKDVIPMEGHRKAEPAQEAKPAPETADGD